MQLSKTQIKDNMDLLFLLSKRQIKHGPNVEKSTIDLFFLLSTFVPTLHGVADNKDKPDPGLTWKDFQLLLLLVGDLKTDTDIKTKTFTTYYR